ncbi:uncharacterized protein [Anolis sagrei]|uniref:uncharacterized protein n=1 Tax=Anolis sagrei TaxID=38937 RepID=UPI003522AA19
MLLLFGSLQACPPLQRVSELPGPTAREFLKAKVQETEALFHEFQREAQEVAQLKADCQRLHQELQEAKGIQKTGILTDFLPKFFKTDFHIQVRVTGKTGGCEDQFLKKVSDRLSDHRIKLKPERYREGSSLFLLVFCPVVSRVGTDMQNALEGLQGEPKAVLVMLHHKLKENTFYVDTKPQAQHPAIVRTVHARYILDVGFYTCPMNEEAVAIVAEVLEDRCKGGKRDTTTPGTPSKS